MIQKQTHQYSISSALGRIWLLDQLLGLGHGKWRMFGLFVANARDLALRIDALALASPVAHDGADHRCVFFGECAGPLRKFAVQFHRCEAHIDRADGVPLTELPLNKALDQAPGHAGPGGGVSIQIANGTQARDLAEIGCEENKICTVAANGLRGLPFPIAHKGRIGNVLICQMPSFRQGKRRNFHNFYLCVFDTFWVIHVQEKPFYCARFT
jgi:hypothetical protein